MRIERFLSAALLLTFATVAQAEDDTTVEIASFEDAAKFVQKYCFECHSGEEPEADLNLARYESVSALTDDIATWTKIVRRVRDGVAARRLQRNIGPRLHAGSRRPLRKQFVAMAFRPRRRRFAG
jgi:hypothetical protein